MVDNDYLYWAEPGTYREESSGLADFFYNMDGRIRRVRKSGGPAETLAKDLDNPSMLALRGDSILFRTGGHYHRNSWTDFQGIFRLTLKDGSIERTAAQGVLADKQFTYSLRIEFYGASGTYGRASHKYIERRDAQGQASTLYTTDHDISSLKLDQNDLFWLEGTDYRLMKLRLP